MNAWQGINTNMQELTSKRCKKYGVYVRTYLLLVYNMVAKMPVDGLVLTRQGLVRRDIVFSELIGP